MLIEDALPTADVELYRRVDEIAHYVWDPIGIKDLVAARDEYSSYHLGLFSRAKAKDRDAVIEFMRWVVEKQMGLLFDNERATSAATLMVQWAEELEARESDQ